MERLNAMLSSCNHTVSAFRCSSELKGLFLVDVDCNTTVVAINQLIFDFRGPGATLGNLNCFVDGAVIDTDDCLGTAASITEMISVFETGENICDGTTPSTTQTSTVTSTATSTASTTATTTTTPFAPDFECGAFPHYIEALDDSTCPEHADILNNMLASCGLVKDEIITQICLHI